MVVLMEFLSFSHKKRGNSIPQKTKWQLGKDIVPYPISFASVSFKTDISSCFITDQILDCP
jgi:hypothetical protein